MRLTHSGHGCEITTSLPCILSSSSSSTALGSLLCGFELSANCSLFEMGWAMVFSSCSYKKESFGSVEEEKKREIRRREKYERVCTGKAELRWRYIPSPVLRGKRRRATTPTFRSHLQ